MRNIRKLTSQRKRNGQNDPGTNLSEMMTPERVVQQLVLVHGPEQITIEQRYVVRQLFGAERLDVHVNAIGGALLFRQRCLHTEFRSQINRRFPPSSFPIFAHTHQRVQMVFGRHENAPIQAQCGRHADVVIFENAPLAVRIEFDQQQILGDAVQFQLVGRTGLDDLGRCAHRKAQRAVRVVRTVDAENDYEIGDDWKTTC